MAKVRVIVQVEGSAMWYAHQDAESAMWVATCPVLNLTAIGETWAELQEAGNQATTLLFEEHFEAGELEKFAKDLGWTVRRAPQGGQPRFDIPTLWEAKESAGFLTPALA